MMSNSLKLITTRSEALEAWDKSSVIIREKDGHTFVYPQLSRGVKYPDLDLCRECCLNTFVSVQKAKEWAVKQSYSYAVVR